MFRIAMVAALVSFTSSLAGAAGGITTDGFWWNDLPNAEKADVMAAAIAAYQAGWTDARAAARQSMPSFDGQPIAVYVDRMNGFFANHTDVTGIDVSAVLACVRNRPRPTCDAIAAAYRTARAARAAQP